MGKWSLTHVCEVSMFVVRIVEGVWGYWSLGECRCPKLRDRVFQGAYIGKVVMIQDCPLGCACLDVCYLLNKT